MSSSIIRAQRHCIFCAGSAAIILAGAAAGLAVYVLFARLLTTLGFEMSVLDLTTVAFSLVLVLVVATVATWVPARRAAQLDPARALSAD